MAKVEVNKVELVWPGKYNEDGTLKEVPRVSLPFQVIERVNESRATRETAKHGTQLGLFETWQGREGPTFEEGWRSKLIWGDNELVMDSLLARFAGKIDLIYIDPPFATGADFSFGVPIGDAGEELAKEQSVIEDKAYRDTWGRGLGSYINMMSPRLQVMRDLLSEAGSIYVHLDWHVGHYVKLLIDELFGAKSFVNEIVWHYGLGAFQKQSGFPSKHDVILFYSKGESFTFNKLRGDPTPQMLAKYSHEDENGRYMMSYGKKYYLKGGKPIDDVWEVPTMAATSGERLGFPTQKPEALLEQVIEASSDRGALLADFFCGSGTTLAVAEKLGRRWIGCDLSRFAIHTTRKRLLEIEGCKPFEVLNLGKYERQYWQGVTFKKKGQPQQQALFEYLAFILRLYGAQPVSGMHHLHGKKGRALVHIGAVDAPVTIDEVSAAVEECLAVKQTELHVLGWEWEMGMVGMMEPEAKRRGVRLLLLQIPREVMEQQAVDKGDVQFFQLAYLEVEIKSPKKLTARVSLTDFVIPNTELIPEDVRDKVKKWSDWVDYWAVDWDFQEDTFMQGWVAYRTRKERALPLKSDPHTYPRPGKYTIVVKVIDIFGNDTTQAFVHEVK
jgi:DNA modification methylase